MTPDQLRAYWLAIRSAEQAMLLETLTDLNANEITAKRDALKEFHRVMTAHLDTFKRQQG